MLFNSHQFLLVFLPLALAGFWALGALGYGRLALLWLLGSSLVFYAAWLLADLWLLLASMVFNYLLSGFLARSAPGSTRQRVGLIFGITANLSLLAYFKYSAFFVQNVNALTGWSWTVEALVLPLAISFYTFQQIAFLVEASRGEFEEPNFIDYCSVVTFFPHLIAGPIINYRDVIAQFRRPGAFRPRDGLIALGVGVFVIGLAKKVLLADRVSTQADAVFGAVAAGTPVSLFEAWAGAIAYTLQLYFDFSGYSDMAIGLALLFGIRLPLNFNSPYKAHNIVDFWRRWHMTLSHFLRNYLYIALGGNRKGPARRYGNLLVTMVLGGLWHGAGWTFVIWGALHGIYLMVCHGWQALRERLGWVRQGPPSLLGTFAARTLTLLAVMVGWVFFRADSIPTALTLLGTMSGLGAGEVAPLRTELLAGPGSGAKDDVVIIATLLAVALFAPNTQEWTGYSPAAKPAAGLQWMHRLSRRPAFAAALGCLFVFMLTQMSAVQVFLYFQF